MPLSSELAVNRLKLSNTAGKITQNTGTNSLFAFKLKPKTQTTLRNIFGGCSWADPFSFGDYLQAHDVLNIATAQIIDITSPLVDTSCLAIIYHASAGEGILDAMTGVEATGLVFLSANTFLHDLGNVPVPSNIFTVQSSLPNTDVTLENGNRILQVEVL
jgi:hypothetical protein